jgi:uncharacterized protein
VADVTPRVAAGALILQAYTPEGFTVGGAFHKGALLLAKNLLQPLDVAAVADLAPQHVAGLAGKEIRYLILGCGAKPVLPPQAFAAALKAAGMACEPMTTAAACRTYNVLLGEGRDIAALLIPG